MTLPRNPFRPRFFRRSEDGSASIEFVMLFPIFMVVLISSIESGILMTRHIMLDRAVDINVRQLRLGITVPPTYIELKRSICNTAGLIPDCMNTMRLELQPVSTDTWNPLNAAAECRNRSEEIEPKANFVDGEGNSLMLVRACAMLEPIFPGTGLGLKMKNSPRDGYALVSTSAYVNEPR